MLSLSHFVTCLPTTQPVQNTRAGGKKQYCDEDELGGRAKGGGDVVITYF